MPAVQVFHIEKRVTISGGLNRHITRVQWVDGKLVVWVPANANEELTKNNVELVSREFTNSNGTKKTLSLQEAVNKIIKEDDSSLIKVELRDLKSVLGDVVVNDTVEYSIGDNKDDLINKYLITIEKFDSDRVRGKIAEFNERCFLNQKPGKKFKEIKVSETGLEMIESISVDCTRKTGAWHSDTEILIDKFGLVRLNGTKANKYWNGTIACSKKPLRLRLRNICGDETVVVV